MSDTKPASATPIPDSTLRGWLTRLGASRANARAGLVADTVVSVALFAAGAWYNRSGLLAVVATIAGGLLLFTFIEYCFHRWLFHGHENTVEAGHRKHHEGPAGYDALPFFLPPLGMVALAGILALLLPPDRALFFAAALAAGYAGYGLVHTAIHTLRFRNRLLARWAALHHIHHHHPERNFGVTTPLWDFILGTRYVSAMAARRSVQ